MTNAGGIEPLSRQSDIRAFIAAAPKAELHVHLEGCLDPDLIQRLSKRNGVTVEQDHEKDHAGHDDPLGDFLEKYLDGDPSQSLPRDFKEVFQRARQMGKRELEKTSGSSVFLVASRRSNIIQSASPGTWSLLGTYIAVE